jgi:hypothetical protein
MSSATVRHVTKDHIHLAPGPSYNVTIFQLKDQGAEAIVSARDGTETSRLKIEAPTPGRKIVLVSNEDGSFDIFYKDAEPDHV